LHQAHYQKEVEDVKNNSLDGQFTQATPASAVWGRDIQSTADHTTTTDNFSYPQLTKLGSNPTTEQQAF